MNNITTLDPFWHADVLTESTPHVRGISATINQHLVNITTVSSLDIYNSTHTNHTADTPVDNEPSLAGLATYLAACTLSGILAILGNSLTIYAVAKFERLQTCTNYLICSLAVSDILAGLMVPLVLVHELYRNSWFFIRICLIQQGLALVSAGGNLLNILYLSIDRYIYIAHALRYNDLVTPRRIVIILTVTWVHLLLTVPTLMVTANHLQVGMPCRYHMFLNEHVLAIYMFPQVLLFFGSTIGLHFAIARIAHKQARQIAAQQQPYNTLDVAIHQSTKKIWCTLGLVLGAYVCSIMPTFILGAATLDFTAQESYDRYTIAIYWANTWVNPLIYTWRLKDFKIAFKKIFTGTGSFIEVPGMVP